MKNYVAPMAEILHFQSLDIITTSDNGKDDIFLT